MLNDKQIELARTEPKAFLEQFRLLRVRYENELDRVNFWQNCEACIARARRLVSLEADIANLLDTVEIKEDYRLFMHLRFIACLSMSEVSARMLITRRWAQRLQNRALLAFAQSV